jgi:hypothetical protein
MCQDVDLDGVPDYLDLDSDNNGLPDNREALLGVFFPILPTGPDDDKNGLLDIFQTLLGLTLSPVDTDNGRTDDFLELDSDNDGISNTEETQASPLSALGALLGDANSSGIDDFYKANPFSPRDQDEDSRANHLDVDSDNDGIPDHIESRANAMTPKGQSFRDSNGNGLDATWDTQEGGVVTFITNNNLPDT